MNIHLKWTDFKLKASSKTMIRCSEYDYYYRLSYDFFETTIAKDGEADQIDFEANYKSSANKAVTIPADIDDQGRQIYRNATARSGWSYLAHPFEIQTSKLNSLINKNHQNIDRNNATVKFYDANNTEITNEANEIYIVKTVMTFKPSYDYELVAGSVRQIETPLSDINLWVIGGVLELGELYTREFVGGINLKFIGADEELKTDGRTAKYMRKTIDGCPYNANQIQLIIRHSPGTQHKILFLLEYYKA